MRLPEGLRALNHRDYRLFFAGQLVSMIGTWMQTVGQSWLIIELTNSALKLGFISTLQFLPTLVFSLFGGALADRLPKRRTIVATQTVMMLLAFALSALAWSGKVQYWHVAVLALLLGLTTTLDNPVRQAFTVELVGGKEDLRNAIALNSTLFSGARLVGPAVAGLLVARYGVGLAFFLNGVSFLAVIGALLVIKAEGLPKPRPKKPLLGDIVDGLKYAYRTPVIFFLISLMLGIGLFVVNFQVLVTVLAKGVLHTGPQGYGYLMTALGCGALVGAGIMAMRRGSTPGLTPLVVAALILCVAEASMFLVHQFWLACAVLFVIGVSQVLYTADSNTNLQFRVPDEMRGRVLSMNQLMFLGTTPLGSLITGAVIERSNGSVGFLVDGGLGLLSALLLLLWWQRSRNRGEGLPKPGPAQVTV